MQSTCPDCGLVLTSTHRTPSLGTHRGSKVCAQRKLQKQMEETGQGHVPRVWRWILQPIGIKVDVPDGVDADVFVPDWVAEVVAVARTRGSSRGWEMALDVSAEAAVKFIEACKKEPQLAEALKACGKLGGRKAQGVFMDEHREIMKAFRGTK